MSLEDKYAELTPEQRKIVDPKITSLYQKLQKEIDDKCDSSDSDDDECKNNLKGKYEILMMNAIAQAGGSTKIFYKGHRYKLRVEGRSKYILCKGAKVPLKDVRAWQKQAGKK